MTYDLLSTVEYGGCSAKLNAADLEKALAGLPTTPHKDLLVDINTHDDAGVIKISDELALIQTTDFFRPSVPIRMNLAKLPLPMPSAMCMPWEVRCSVCSI